MDAQMPSAEASPAELPAREAMEFDVVIVGAGPAGLAAAIRLKQIKPEISVVVVEKGSEVGAHILSGAVIDPIGLDRLLPDWRDEDSPIKTKVSDDKFYWFSAVRRIAAAEFSDAAADEQPRQLHRLARRGLPLAGGKAEALGVEIYPGFAAAEVLYDDNGRGRRHRNRRHGHRQGRPAEGRISPAAWSCAPNTRSLPKARAAISSKILLQDFGLEAEREPQKFGIGLKELWQVAPEKHQPGLVQHSFGWPLDGGTGGGSFLYHYGDNLVSVGFVVHLNYENPYLSPFDEFQRFKTHPRDSRYLRRRQAPLLRRARA